MKDILATIRVPRSKTELAEWLGVTEEELTLLLDSHCPEGHIVHEKDGHIQVIPFDQNLCAYISPAGKQCKTRPRNSKLYCACHYPKRSLSPELRLFAACLEEWGLPFSKERWNWPRSEEARRAKKILLNFSPRTKRDREFISLVAKLQKKAAKGKLTKADEEKLLSLIRGPRPLRPGKGCG
jgi:hypothetical protein